jgi:hypothetical protein
MVRRRAFASRRKKRQPIPFRHRASRRITVIFKREPEQSAQFDVRTELSMEQSFIEPVLTWRNETNSIDGSARQRLQSQENPAHRQVALASSLETLGCTRSKHVGFNHQLKNGATSSPLCCD